jgi:hypothetical protein
MVAIEHSDLVAQRITKLVIAEMEQSAERSEFGIILQDVAPLNLETLVSAFAGSKHRKSGKLRLALVGGDAVVADALEADPSLTDTLSQLEETAVAWRNKRLRTIVVVANRPLAKAASLRDFRPIDERDIAKRLCAEQRDLAEVTWLQTLWDTLERGKGLRLPLGSIATFALTLEKSLGSIRSTLAPNKLHLLGLFPDAHLADEKTEQRLLRRLQQNRELVSQLRRATDEDWNRIRTYCRTLNGPDKTNANKLLRRLRDFGAANDTLEGIDFTDALNLWKAKSTKAARTERPEGGQERVEVERAIARMLIDGDESRASDIAEEVTQITKAVIDEDARLTTQDVKQASSTDRVATVEANRELIALVRSRSTDLDWGGLIDIESEKPDALTEVSAFKAWAPFRVEPILEQLTNFTSEELLAASAVEQFEQLIAIRKTLVPFVAELATSPIAILAGRSDVLEATEKYLSTYEEVLRLVGNSYHEMLAAADFEAETVLGQLLGLELYVYRRGGEIVEAAMSPLHPLYLWRSATIVRDIKGLGGILSDHEAQTLEEASAEELQFLQVLVLPKHLTNQPQTVMLGQAGAIGRLPIFRAAPRGLLEVDGVRTTAEIAEHLAKLRPFVRPGLQVVLVNVPRPSRFLEDLLAKLDLENTSSDDTYWGVHVRVRYTHPDTRGWGNEIAELDELVQERVRAGEERGLVSLSVDREPTDWDHLLRELRERPTHLVVVIDPFEVRSTPVARAAIHSLTPWMPTCEYRFNRIRKEIQVIPVAEEHVFGSYLSAASLLHPALQRKTPAHLPQVRAVKEFLDEIASLSTWTVIADPHRVPLARLGSAEVIDRRIERGRQLTSFAHDLAPFIRRLDAQLRATHFRADSDTLEHLIRDLVSMEPNGILGLASSSHEKQVKGSLGKLIAMRWYRIQQPSGFAVSLDTQSAARWLVAGHHSKERADLLGLREEDGSLVIDVLEVKAHDEAMPYVVSNGQIGGRAVGQVLATLQALAEVFSSESNSPLQRPRREVLREHLYTALLRDQQADFVERWHLLLEDAFDGKIPVRLTGRIVHVQLSSVARTPSQVYMTAEGVPVRVDTLSAEDVGLVLKTSKLEKVQPLPESGLDISDVLEPTPTLKLLMQTEHKSGHVELEVEREEIHQDLGSDLPPVTHELPRLAQVDPSTAVTPASNTLEVRVGREHTSSKEVIWQPGRLSNGFLLVLGASGSGKTETLKVLSSSISEFGVPVLVFDFHGDVVFPGLKSFLLSSGSASKLGLNPMELDTHSAEESGLYDQRAALRGLIQRATPSLGHRQSNILRDAFDEAYRRAGILDGDPSTWNLPPPTFSLVQEILGEWSDDDSKRSQRAAIEGCLAAVRELFDHPIFQRHDHISIDQLLSESTRLDLSKLPDEIRFVATETLLRKIFRVLRLQGPIPVQPADDHQRFRLFIVIDEAKILSLGGGERDRADNILNELITEARKFGLGMILASQMSDHFSEEVRANAATWIVLKPMDVREAKRNAPNVSVDAQDLLQLAGRGDGYYRDRPSSRARRIQVRSLAETSPEGATEGKRLAG